MRGDRNSSLPEAGKPDSNTFLLSSTGGQS